MNNKQRELRRNNWQGKEKSRLSGTLEGKLTQYLKNDKCNFLTEQGNWKMIIEYNNVEVSVDSDMSYLGGVVDIKL